ncbi:CRISPR-associated endonuclease Cas1 [bacterium]|nr:CRISPR-associated endonuclease Cas1 [bacterium]
MSVIYISEQGVSLSKSGNAIQVYREKELVRTLPMINVTQLILLGNVDISVGLMSFLMNEGIETSFLTINGRFKGKLIGEFSKNIDLRVNQFRLCENKDFCLKTAKLIIEAKVKNYQRLLQRREKINSEVNQKSSNFFKIIGSIDDLETLRGYEGSFSVLYFRWLPEILVNSFGFKKRIKHPPPDPLNILLSFAYTLLFQNIFAFVSVVGFDPYKGFFHQTRYGHPALVSDLMEEFRAPIADSLVIQLINRKEIRDEHFLKDEKIALTKEGIEILVKAYAEKVHSKRDYKGMQLDFLQIIERQVRQFAKVINGEEEFYIPFLS